LRARICNRFIVIEIANMSLKYRKTDPRVRVNSNSVLWKSPLLDFPILVPIER
jgi:hypothetical protein